jgi:hypothetical protein
MLSWGVKTPKTLSRTGVVGNWKPWNLTWLAAATKTSSDHTSCPLDYALEAATPFSWIDQALSSSLVLVVRAGALLAIFSFVHLNAPHLTQLLSVSQRNA